MAPLKQYGTQQVKRAVINTNTSGNTTIVAAVTNTILRVRSVVLMAGGSVNATFQTGAGGTALTGPMPLAANTGFSAAPDEEGHFETAAGALLNLNLSGAVQVSGWITYWEVPAKA